VLGAAHPEELPFPVLLRILEEEEEDPACDPGKAYPEALPLLLHLKEMQEDIYRRGDAQVSTKNLKAPHECPAVGMKLGGGNVDFSKKLPFEGSEREMHSYALEHGLVHEEEGFPLSRFVVQTNRFPRPAGTNGYVGVVCAAEGIKVVQMGIPPVSFQVLEGSQAGAFTQELVGGPGVEGFVVGLGGRGGRIRLRVRARHGENR